MADLLDVTVPQGPQPGGNVLQSDASVLPAPLRAALISAVMSRMGALAPGGTDGATPSATPAAAPGMMPSPAAPQPGPAAPVSPGGVPSGPVAPAPTAMDPRQQIATMVAASQRMSPGSAAAPLPQPPSGLQQKLGGFFDRHRNIRDLLQGAAQGMQMYGAARTNPTLLLQRQQLENQRQEAAARIGEARAWHEQMGNVAEQRVAAQNAYWQGRVDYLESLGRTRDAQVLQRAVGDLAKIGRVPVLDDQGRPTGESQPMNAQQLSPIQTANVGKVQSQTDVNEARVPVLGSQVGVNEARATDISGRGSRQIQLQQMRDDTAKTIAGMRSGDRDLDRALRSSDRTDKVAQSVFQQSMTGLHQERAQAAKGFYLDWGADQESGRKAFEQYFNQQANAAAETLKSSVTPAAPARPGRPASGRPAPPAGAGGVTPPAGKAILYSPTGQAHTVDAARVKDYLASPAYQGWHQ